MSINPIERKLPYETVRQYRQRMADMAEQEYIKVLRWDEGMERIVHKIVPRRRVPR